MSSPDTNRTPPSGSGPATARRVISGFAGLVTLVAGSALTATADPTPTIPSQQSVARARAAASSASTRVAAIEAEYAAAAAALVALQRRAAGLGEQANGAAWLLEQRTRDAKFATQRARSATVASRRAAGFVREYAATLYQQGSPIAALEPMLAPGGPTEIADRATTLAIIGDLRSQQLQSALISTGTATSLEAAADRALELESAATIASVGAEKAVRAELARATEQAAQLAANRSALAAQLAALRSTSVLTEKARLDALAAAAEEASQRPPETGSPTTSSTSTRPTSTTTRPTSTTSTTTRPTPTPTSTSTSTSTTTTSTTTRPPSTTTTTRPPSTSTTTRPPSTSTTTRPPSTTTSTSTTTTSTSTSTTPPPPPATGVAAVLSYATAQLGKPYEWAADGPDTFDCSGLTMRAWEQAGVYLSHYTGAQWAETRRVAIADLMPGDLVFFGSTGETSHHVGLYVGNGQMIEAPYTGAVVRYAPIARSGLLPYGGRP